MFVLESIHTGMKLSSVRKAISRSGNLFLSRHCREKDSAYYEVRDIKTQRSLYILKSPVEDIIIEVTDDENMIYGTRTIPMKYKKYECKKNYLLPTAWIDQYAWVKAKQQAVNKKAVKKEAEKFIKENEQEILQAAIDEGVAIDITGADISPNYYYRVLYDGSFLIIGERAA